MPWIRFLAVASLSMVVASAASGQFFVVDFEGLAEGTEIDEQFADLGVTFSVGDEPDLLPIIAVEGNPRVAFTGSGSDRPMSSLAGGLTDPVIGGDDTVPNDIVMDFDPPITSVRFFIIDIDGSDVFTARVFDGETEIATVTRQAGDPGTGNGRSTPFEIEAPVITRVVVDLPEAGPIGWALDFLTFTRTCEGPGCGVEVQIAQESEPGAGDFDENVLGFIRPYPFSGSAAEFFAYGVPEGSSWNGPVLTPEADRSHMVFAGTAVDDFSLFIVHDRAIPDDPDGGQAEMSFEVFDDPDGVVRTVEDDPESDGVDDYTGEPGDSLFTSDHSWEPCCTDGVALSGFACRSATIVQFTDVDGNPGNPTIQGLLEWVAYSASGEQVVMTLEEDRRVRLVVFPDPECPADLNCTDTVDFADVLILLAAWGPCGSCPEDIDRDGTVGFSDVLVVLGAWGPCAGG